MKRGATFFLIFFIFCFSQTNAQNWKSLLDSASVLQNEEKNDIALKMLLKIRKGLLKDSALTMTLARTNGQIGYSYMMMEEYESSETYYLQERKILEQISEVSSVAYEGNTMSLGSLYHSFGQFEKSKEMLLTAQDLFIRRYGRNDPNYANLCNSLGILYADMSVYDSAEYYLKENARVRKAYFGKMSDEYTNACNNLGVLYNDMGEFEKAEEALEECKQIREVLSGPDDISYGDVCLNLGNLYFLIGNFRKAEQLYLHTERIVKVKLGDNNLRYAECAGSLGNLYAELGEHTKAHPYYLKSLAITQKIFGKEHPAYSNCLSNLGLSYADMNQLSKAEPLLAESKRLNGILLGNDHPSYGDDCFNLAELYKKLSQYNKAEPLYIEDRNIIKKSLGTIHPSYANSNSRLASLYWLTGKPDKAKELYKEALDSKQAALQKVFRFTNEAEQIDFLKGMSRTNYEYLSFAKQTKTGIPGLTYDVSIVSRDISLLAGQKLRRFFYDNEDSSLQSKYGEWIKSREQISFWLSRPIKDRGDQLKNAEKRSASLEKELTRYYNSGVSGNEEVKTKWNDIQDRLDTTEAAIEFLSFQYYNGKSWTPDIFYMAAILRNDYTEPVIIHLCGQLTLDSMFAARRSSGNQHFLNALYKPSSDNALYKTIWQPLEAHLIGIKTVFYSLTGSLHKISFAAIPVDAEKRLCDKYVLRQLTTTASVGGAATFLGARDKFILYGGIKYDPDLSGINHVNEGIDQHFFSRSIPEDLLRDIKYGFTYLPGSEREVNTISTWINPENVKVVTGNAATEESIKQLNGKYSPEVLHIATHGFFFPDIKIGQRDIKGGGATVFKQSDNPLIRSGLILAAANHAWLGKQIKNAEDGILTAYEATNLFLPNTKLIVLSACETGLGDIQGDEGVYGLQRAFRIAGVQNLVMSLWKVPDAETAEFMQQFYKNLFAKQAIQDAFYNAQTIMKNKYRNDPYKWAAWVLIR